jgi:hypothetical protein
MLVVREQWQQVVILAWPGDACRCNGVHVNAWCTVLQLILVAEDFIEVLNHVIHLLEVPESIHVPEVASEEDQNLFGAVGGGAIFENLNEF